MTRWRMGLVLGLVALGVIISARLTLRAQERAPRGPVEKGARKPVLVEPVPESGAPASATVSIQDALHRPFPLPFGTPTPLGEVCRHLGRVLRGPVVLDKAALDRQELTPEDTVQLELEGVQLKTGLKLLFDQVGLTYRVVPEDNLLIVTDQEGSADPMDRVLAELRALHRHVHDLRDAMDFLREDLGLDEGGPKMRKPTIIEERPEEKAGEKPEANPPGPGHEPKPGSGTGSSSRSRPGI
jgi:hypothetical protein